MPNTFTDLSDECAREGKIGRFLDMANPALYIRYRYNSSEIIKLSGLMFKSSENTRKFSEISYNQIFGCKRPLLNKLSLKVPLA